MSKLLYSMGEVTEMFDVNASLIRYWESKFDCLKPKKNKKGNRLFTPEDVENLKLIYHLVKEKGMTLEGANRTMKRNRHGVAHESSVLERLQKIRAMLVEVRESLKEEGTVKYEQTDEAANTADEIPAIDTADDAAADAAVVTESAPQRRQAGRRRSSGEAVEGDKAQQGDTAAGAAAPKRRRKRNDDEKELFPFYEQSLF